MVTTRSPQHGRAAVTPPSAALELADIESARALLRPVLSTTPMEYSGALSEVLGCPVHLKAESLQRAGSFKVRGAYVRMARLCDAEKARGVVTASAGNHGQGVALAGRLLGIPVTVVVPVGSSLPKIVATEGYGAQIEMLAGSLADCMIRAADIADETGAVLVHPYESRDVLAGQGTVGLEIVEQVPDVATVLVPLGGGGLLAGVATAVRARRPECRVIGVQPEAAAPWPPSLERGHPVTVGRMASMADGLAVDTPGDTAFQIVRELVHSVETVREESLSAALLLLLERAKLSVEPAGAAGVAQLLEAGPRSYDGPIVAVLSGGNIDPALLQRLIRHGLVVEGRHLQFRVRLPDVPGSLADLLAAVADLGANIIQVEHTRSGSVLRFNEVEVVVQCELRGHAHREAVVEALRRQGLPLTLD